MNYQVFTSDGWVAVEKPSNGDRYKIIHDGGGTFESVWYEISQAEPVRVIITGLSISGTQQITPRNRVVLRAGQSLGVVAETRQGDQIVPVTDSFALPIGRVNGAVETTERAEFIGGVANMLIPFPSAGEFEVTQALLNLYLPPEQQMLFDTFNISVTRT